MNAVIDRKAVKSITQYIQFAEKSNEAEIISGGTYDDTTGYFISPTTILTTNPSFKTLEEEIFGPVLTIYIYDPSDWYDVLKLIDTTSPYALTGCVMGKDRKAIKEAPDHLTHAAGNFYINDKPTGAVVGQQPFGGCRVSGTDDKAGSKLNLLRWVSPRLVSRTHNPPTSYPYDYMD